MERHQKTATIVTSNRDPSEWMAMMSDPLLAQSGVDRLTATSYELLIEGESYRRRQRPQTHIPNGVSVDPERRTDDHHDPRWSLGRGNRVVPSGWQATAADTDSALQVYQGREIGQVTISQGQGTRRCGTASGNGVNEFILPSGRA